MSPSPRRTVYVGLFVAIATVVFGGAILAVGTIKNSFTPKIAATAVFEDVGGLQSGHAVWSSGMRVGVVKSLAFVEGGDVQVTLQINTSMAPFIPADSEATVGSDGLIGNPIVQLSGGTKGGPSLEDGDELSIGEALSMSKMMETLQVNNENLVEITEDIKVITGRLKAGEGAIGKLLTEDALYDDARAAVADIQAASANAKSLTASLSRFSAQLNEPGQLPYDLVHDEEIMPAARAAIADLQTTVAKVAEIAEGLAADVDDPATPLGVLLSDQEAGGDVKQTLANLQETTVLLNEDLIAIRSNFLFRPYFRKQEREAAKAAKAAAKAGK